MRRGGAAHANRRCWCGLALLVLAAWVLALCRRRRRHPSDDRSLRVPAWALREPDPMIYSQSYLQGLGFAITWDNPDIWVERNGAVVDQHTLRPGETYDVVARVWNGSTSGPAVDLPVVVTYLAFGIGTASGDVGKTTVDLPVKGAPGCPAFARVPWTTPTAPGHYCLQVHLDWPAAHDAEPANNLGQSNTDVVALNSPVARFTFALRNDAAYARDVRLTADAYVVGDLPSCDERPRPEEIRRRHDPAAHPVPEGWSVDLEPAGARLRAGESIDVGVIVTAPDGFRGRKTFNVHGWAGEELLGGVTLTAEGTA